MKIKKTIREKIISYSDKLSKIHKYEEMKENGLTNIRCYGFTDIPIHISIKLMSWNGLLNSLKKESYLPQWVEYYPHKKNVEYLKTYKELEWTENGKIETVVAILDNYLIDKNKPNRLYNIIPDDKYFIREPILYWNRINIHNYVWIYD